jgi:prepilin signal peptidase PulO-like enzyme (type II secretory pathway)
MVLGVVIGSFLSSYSYRVVRGLSVKKGRSFCPSCKNIIPWFCNIPLFSFLILKGKCFKCKRPISVRYPLIEVTTAFVFVGFWWLINSCGSPLFRDATICQIWLSLGSGGNQLVFLILFYLILSILILLFITDYEKMLLPDGPLFLGILLVILLLLITGKPIIWEALFHGFTLSFFILFLFFVTMKKGMGLGDVKLVILLGSLLGWTGTLSLITLASLIGSLVGITLILFKKASFGKAIPFGPFLIVSFMINLFLEGILNKWLL